MKRKINVGVVGCGYWGPNLLRNFRSLPGCNAKVICDLDLKRLNHLKTLYPEVEICTSFEDLLAREDIDALVIATSVRLHFSMAKQSLLAGKHTFIEKPMATSAADCEELVRIAKEKDLTLMVGHTFLYSAPVRRIREIIKAGDLGQIQYISARRLNLGLFQRDINVAWDLAPHDISIINYITDDVPIRVNCRGNSHVTKGIEDVTNMALTFENGGFATIHNSWLDPRKVREMTIVGSRRMIVYDDVQPLEKIRIYDTRVETPPHYDTFAEFHYSYHYGDSYVPYIKQEEPLKVECQHFLDCIESGSRPITDGVHGLEVVRILEASSLSLKQEGAPIAVANGEVHPAGNGRGSRNGRRSGGTREKVVAA